MARHSFDYIAVGHVTCDALVDGRRQPGGTAFYSALQAARLGLNAMVFTKGVPAEIEDLLAPYRDELALHVIPAAHTTTLATHGLGTKRRQRLLAWAGPIDEPIDLDSRIVHLAPIARETPLSWRPDAGRDGTTGRGGDGPGDACGNGVMRSGAPFLGITPQGLIRAWQGPGGEIEPMPLRAETLPERFDAAVISETERPMCSALFAAAGACGACVAVTAGAQPASVHVPDGEGDHVLHSAAAHAVAVRDDIGAGDVFAAAFFVALAKGRDPLAAASFANAAAAVRIAGVGPSSIGTRAQIEAITP